MISARGHPPRRYIAAKKNMYDLIAASLQPAGARPVYLTCSTFTRVLRLYSRRHAPSSPDGRTLPLAVGGRTGRPKPATFPGGPKQFKASLNSLLTRA